MLLSARRDFKTIIDHMCQLQPRRQNLCAQTMQSYFLLSLRELSALSDTTEATWSYTGIKI